MNTELQAALFLRGFQKYQRNGVFINQESYYVTGLETPSYLERYYFILTAFLLFGRTTTESIIPIYMKYDFDSNPEKSKFRFENVIRMMSNNKKRNIGKSEYGILLAKKRKEGSVLFNLTKDGVNLLKYLNSKFVFPEGITRLTEEEIDSLYQRLKNKSDRAHTLFVNRVAAEIISKTKIESCADFYFEAGRNNSYEPHVGIRNEKEITPDISLMIKTEFLKNSAVFYEADLGTESGKKLQEKIQKEIDLGYKMQKWFYNFPLTVLFVCDEPNEILSQLSLETKEGHREELRRKKFCSPDMRMLMALIADFYATNSNDIYIKDGAFSVAESLQATLIHLTQKSHPVFLDQREYTSFFEDMTNEILAWEKETGKVLNAFNFECFFDRQEAEPVIKKSKKRRNIKKTVNKRVLLFNKFCNDEETIKKFIAGQSLYMCNIRELGEVLPVMQPYVSGIGQVRSLLNYLGLKGHVEKYWPSKPVIRDGPDYYVNLRNCYLVDGVCIAIEDITYDLSAISRIRDYLVMPSSYAKNLLLVIIINDDLTTANGKDLSAIVYWDLFGTEGESEFQKMFFSRFKNGERIPFYFREANDFCFLKRSEFLSKGPYHPFIKMKGRRWDRTLDLKETVRINYKSNQTYHASQAIVDNEFSGY